MLPVRGKIRVQYWVSLKVRGKIRSLMMSPIIGHMVFRGPELGAILGRCFPRLAIPQCCFWSANVVFCRSDVVFVSRGPKCGSIIDSIIGHIGFPWPRVGFNNWSVFVSRWAPPCCFLVGQILLLMHPAPGTE